MADAGDQDCVEAALLRRAEEALAAAERIRGESSVVPRAEVRESGLVTRCAWCGRFRDGGRWVVVDPVQAPVEQAEITHGICSDCVEALRAAGMSV